MKRKKLILYAVSIILLTSCVNSNQKGNQTDSPHTFAGYPVVYLTSDVSAKGLLSAYKALDPPTAGKIGIKLSETKATDCFIWAELMGELIQMAGVSTIENSGEETGFSDYDSIVFLTHFESDNIVGFYGTLEHLASCAIRQEDCEQFADDADGLMKNLATQGAAVVEELREPVLYIAVLDRWSVEKSMYDRGILASYDPISLDQACIDLINMTEEYQPLAVHIEDCNGINMLINAEEMECGSRTYAFLDIDS